MKVLILGSVWPEPKSSAIGRRMMELLCFFLSQQAEVLFLTSAEKRPHSEALPKEIKTGGLKLNDSSMDSVFAEWDPDIVLFDRFVMEEQYGWRIEKKCPKAMRVLDTMDVHSLRTARDVALKQGREREPSDWFSDIALRELSSILRSDLSLLISQAEFDILQNELPIPAEQLHVLPFLVQESEWKINQPWASFDERIDMVTIGSFLHGPNKDSVQYLREQLWSDVRERCPRANLYVYGADMSSHLEQWSNPKQGFHMMGRAKDALEVISRARLCLAPIRYGAGLKGKMLDSMLTGTPSVTTPVGAEGMDWGLPWPGAIESDSTLWVDAVVKLYTDRKEWDAAQAKILPVLEKYNANHHIPALLERLNLVKKQREKKSADQWFGALLRHHHHRSTEFMSRWIEAKNKKEKS